MKTRIVTFIVALMAIASGVQAQVAINATNFPDENFRNWLLDANNINGYGADGQLTATEIADIKVISLFEKGIANLKGIEYFTSMTELYLDGNPLTSVDVSMHPQLETLWIGFLNLTSIDLSNNTKLKSMGFTGNQFSSFDFTKFPDLEVLLIGNNPMTSIDLSQNPKLYQLTITQVPVTSLNLSANTALEVLIAGQNQLTSLDLSQNTALKSLVLNDSELTDLDLTKNTALTSLRMEKRQSEKYRPLKECVTGESVHKEQ